MPSSQDISVSPKTSDNKKPASKKTTRNPIKKKTPSKTVIKKSPQPLIEPPVIQEESKQETSEKEEPPQEPKQESPQESPQESKQELKQESPQEEVKKVEETPPLEKMTKDEHSPLEFKTQEGILTDDDLEKELWKYGYISLLKIIINDEGEDIVKYIKVVNSQGQKFLVEMDVDGYDLNISDKDLELRPTEAQIIPYSIKVGSYECAQSYVCGVALECVEGICVLSRGSDLTPKEVTFTYHKETLNEYPEVELDESPIIYTVVKLTEIRENSKKIDENINNVMTRMRAKENIQTTKELNDLDEIIKKSLGNLEKFIQIKTETMKKISSVIDQLQQYSQTYKKKSEENTMTDDEKKKYHQTGTLLYERYDLYDKIIMASRDISLYQTNLQALNSSLLEAIKNLETQEKYLNPDRF